MPTADEIRSMAAESANRAELARELNISRGKLYRTIGRQTPPTPPLDLETMVRAEVERRLREASRPAQRAAVAVLPVHPGVVRAERPYERVIGVYDCHFPYADVPALHALLEFATQWKPDLWFLGGDLFDFYGASRFDQDPAREKRLQSEIDSARWFLQRVAEAAAATGADVVYTVGNHEDRLTRLVNKNASCLHDLRALEWSRVLELPAEWLVLPNQGGLEVGGVLWCHGDVRGVNSGGLYPQEKLLKVLKQTFVCGHFHRDRRVATVGPGRVGLEGYTSGWLGDAAKAADYITLPDWRVGFVTADYDHADGVREVRQPLIVGGKLRYDGVTYGSR